MFLSEVTGTVIDRADDYDPRVLKMLAFDTNEAEAVLRTVFMLLKKDWPLVHVIPTSNAESVVSYKVDMCNEAGAVLVTFIFAVRVATDEDILSDEHIYVVGWRIAA